MIKRNMLKLFESRRGHLEYRVKRDYIRNGVATIPCQISEYSDVISSYSVKGCECLNPEFLEYIKSAAEFTPPQYPLVLNIIGDCLSQEEKDIIDDIVRDDLAYELGLVERQEKRHTRIFSFMFVGLIISGILLWLTEVLAEEPRELFFILFWFMGDTLCDYIFLTGHDLREDRRVAGRLASIKVIFSDNYEDTDFTESDVDRLYSEIEKEVNESIQEDEVEEEEEEE